MSISYRKANFKDLKDILEAFYNSKEILSHQGTGQWQDGSPSEQSFIDDINNGNSYLLLNNNSIVGVCALTYKEEDYEYPYEGKWLSNYDYMVMHRVAIKKEYYGKGFGLEFFKLFENVAKEKGYSSIRIDTHEGNKIMKHLIEKAGFNYCGKVILKPNKDRIIYEKII